MESILRSFRLPGRSTNQSPRHPDWHGDTKSPSVASSKSSNRHHDSSSSQSDQSPILIELFQSQGCNSCPPTNDNLVSFVQTHQEYLLLTYQVTYWNYLGWNDTFSLPENDSRQREYVRRMGLKSAYTPMVVVNGSGVGVGNSKNDLNRILREGTASSEHDSAKLQITNISDDVNVEGEQVEVDATALLSRPQDTSSYRKTPQDLQIYQVTYTPSVQDVHITRGENKRRTLAHLNVVKDVQRIGYLERGAKGRFNVQGYGLKRSSSAAEGKVIIVQDGNGGAVLGVLRL